MIVQGLIYALFAWQYITALVLWGLLVAIWRAFRFNRNSTPSPFVLAFGVGLPVTFFCWFLSGRILPTVPFDMRDLLQAIAALIVLAPATPVLVITSLVHIGLTLNGDQRIKRPWSPFLILLFHLAQAPYLALQFVLGGDANG